MTDHLLTKKKKRWVAQFKPTGVIRGTTLHSNAVSAMRYQKRLDALIEPMIAETEKQLTALFRGDAAEKHFAQDESVASQARIITNGLQRKFQQLFNSKANGLADIMVNESKAVSKSSLHMSLKEMSGGLSLKTNIMTNKLEDVMIAATAENAALIKTIPQEYLGKVQGAVMRSIGTGKGLADLVPALEKYKMITKRRAKMIAYDQTRKTFNMVNKARMQNIGIKKAEWIHSGGSNDPRETHKAMNGKIFNIDEGMYDSQVQEYIQPGQLVSCRCSYRPIIEFDEGEAD